MNDGTWTYTWEHGRQLASMTDGTTTWNYTYNSDGLRTRRTNGTTTYDYIFNGGSLVQMTVTNTVDNSTPAVDTLYFTADTVTYNDTVYYYAKNIQGDVIAILNSAGTAVVTYSYDAWGNVIDVAGSMMDTLGTVNLITYRGYVYDTETGLYYLQSRYYNPEIGRFLNADAFASTGQGVLGMNMFAYCGNNPVLNADSSGHAFFPCTFVVNNCGANSSKEEKEADEEINPIHLEELEVLRTKGITFYHGIPVIRVPFLGNAGFSAGIILLGETVCGF